MRRVILSPDTKKWNKEFGKRLKARREELKLTQGEVGKRSGMTQVEISLLERGKSNPLVSTVLALASALNIDPMYLIKF